MGSRQGWQGFLFFVQLSFDFISWSRDGDRESSGLGCGILPEEDETRHKTWPNRKEGKQNMPICLIFEMKNPGDFKMPLSFPYLCVTNNDGIYIRAK